LQNNNKISYMVTRLTTSRANAKGKSGPLFLRYMKSSWYWVSSICIILWACNWWPLLL